MGKGVGMAGREFLHTPGPTHIPDRVLSAMHRQAVDLGDSWLAAITTSCFADLGRVFGTSGPVFAYAANGHGGWEAALTNVCAPGDTVLVPEIGHFSNSWADHARSLGLHVVSIEGDWRHAIDPQAVEDSLRADPERRIKLVLAVQVDTGTSIASDIPAIRAAMDAAGHPALLVADTIASLGAMPFEMDRWGVDVAIAASQKALMCPPGLAILAANDKAVGVSKQLARHQRYWDWGPRLGGETYHKFGGTMPEHLWFGLRAALDILNEEGLPAIFRRHRRLAGAVHRAVAAWSEAGALSFNALVPEQRAVSVTTIRTVETVDPRQLQAHARASLSTAVASGLGALHGRAFRIGHLGDLNEPMVLGCLGALEIAMVELGIPHGKDGLRAAVEHLAQERARHPETSSR